MENKNKINMILMMMIQKNFKIYWYIGELMKVRDVNWKIMEIMNVKVIYF